MLKKNNKESRLNDALQLADEMDVVLHYMRDTKGIKGIALIGERWVQIYERQGDKLVGPIVSIRRQDVTAVRFYNTWIDISAEYERR